MYTKALPKSERRRDSQKPIVKPNRIKNTKSNASFDESVSGNVREVGAWCIKTSHDDCRTGLHNFVDHTESFAHPLLPYKTRKSMKPQLHPPPPTSRTTNPSTKSSQYLQPTKSTLSNQPKSAILPDASDLLTSPPWMLETPSTLMVKLI